MKQKNDTKSIGDFGEDIACSYLSGKSYLIIERNFRTALGELDIIAFDSSKKELVFAEVKTRKNISFGYPCEFVNASKKRKMLKTIMIYLEKNKRLSVFNKRIDIIEILTLDSIYIRHLVNIDVL